MEVFSYRHEKFGTLITIGSKVTDQVLYDVKTKLNDLTVFKSDEDQNSFEVHHGRNVTKDEIIERIQSIIS